MYRKTMIALLCLTGSGVTAGEQTYSDLATAANSIMDQVNLSRTLATGASYYAGVGGDCARWVGNASAAGCGDG